MDCAQISRLAVNVMLRSSEFAGLICDTAAQIIAACAAECGRHPMAHCQECAKACRRAAEECLCVVNQMNRRRQAQTGG